MTHENRVATVVASLNNSIREYEDSEPFTRIRYSMAGWAELVATEKFDCTVADISPELSDLLYRIKRNKGEVNGEDSFTLIDLGIAALDLRAPEDKPTFEEGGM